MTGIEALEQAREKIAALHLAHFLYLDRFISLGSFQKTILNTIDAMIAAERERLPDAGETMGDWPEDFPGENGNYQNKCRVCGRLFTGHKRRVVCKLCVKPEPGAYREAAMAYQDLATCYRLGTRPSEKLFSRIEKARELLSEPVFEEHDRYVYDDAKPLATKPEPGDIAEAWSYYKTRVSLILRGKPCRDLGEAESRIDAIVSTGSKHPKPVKPGHCSLKWRRKIEEAGK